MKRLLAVLLMCCVACNFVDASYSGSGTVKVAILGDSITVASGSYLHSYLDPNYQVMVASATGLTANQTGDSSADPYASLLDVTSPDIVVVNLGTNDLAQGHPDQQLLDDLTALLARFPNSCHVVVTLSLIATGSFVPSTTPLNAQIAALGDVNVQWGDFLASNPSLVNADGVHLKDELAKQTYSNLVKDGVDQCFSLS